MTLLRNNKLTILYTILFTVAVTGCSKPLPIEENPTTTSEVAQSLIESKQTYIPPTRAKVDCNDQQPLRKALFGDLHVHTTYSFDAYSYGVQTTPEDAYRYAKGQAIDFFPVDDDGKMSGSIKIDRPLDFLAVTDHAEFLGEYQLCTSTESPVYDHDFCQTFRKGGSKAIMAVASSLAIDPAQRISPVCAQGNRACLEASNIPWRKIIDAAENANDFSADCSFTAMIGYEYSGSPSSSNYHRNVIFRSGSVPAIPVSKFEAPLDYYLWKELDKNCKKEDGCDYLTIPHNSNLSNGKLLIPYADLPDTTENKIAYAKLRLAREPIMEVFQHKGNSECANGFPDILGAADELCELEQIRVIGNTGRTGRIYVENDRIKYSLPRKNPTVFCEGDKTGYGGMQGNGCLSKNDFYRSALLTGLKEENEIGLNSVKLGASASTDTHMSVAGETRESNWRGHISTEWNKEGRLLSPTLIPSGKEGNPGGLTGVWATENSRDAIFDSMLRREVFGTSGTRIKPRFFASWTYPENLCEDNQMLTTAYEEGVPMGSDLSAAPAADAVPVFLLAALADTGANATPLQKLQLIKGWVDSDGNTHNKVYDVAGDAETKAGVNLETGERFGDGHASLCAVFSDPDFDTSENAYYYMRAVENPSPRWSLLDCLGYSDDERPKECNDERISTAINEQAWTSPIWFNNK